MICYHAVLASAAVQEYLVGHITSTENVVDLLTKVLYGQKRRELVAFFMTFMATISYQF